MTPRPTDARAAVADLMQRRAESLRRSEPGLARLLGEELPAEAPLALRAEAPRRRWLEVRLARVAALAPKIARPAPDGVRQPARDPGYAEGWLRNVRGWGNAALQR